MASDVIIVCECAFAFGVVILVIEVEGLSKKILGTCQNAIPSSYVGARYEPNTEDAGDPPH
jgi:hypothetical protein